MKKVFVAGHRGMVGAAIVRNLEQRNDIEIVTRTRAELNLTDQKEVSSFFAENNIDEVYLAAAKVGGIHANNTYPAEFIYENLMIEANIIHAAHKNNVQKLLFLGSSCIYPKFAKQPIKEDSLLTGKLEPTNEWYAIAKIAGLKLCKAYALQHKRNFISAMPTNLYGPGDNFDIKSGHVLPSLINKVHYAVKHNKKNVILWGTGKPKREFLFVDDLSEALVFLMKNYNEKEHINIGSGIEISILNLAKTIAKVIGFKGKFIFDTSKPDGTSRKFINSKKINSLGWKSKISLLKGIETTYRFYVTKKY